jgi:hypothetical protein
MTARQVDLMARMRGRTATGQGRLGMKYSCADTGASPAGTQNHEPSEPFAQRMTLILRLAQDASIGIEP